MEGGSGADSFDRDKLEILGGPIYVTVLPANSVKGGLSGVGEGHIADLERMPEQCGKRCLGGDWPVCGRRDLQGADFGRGCNQRGRWLKLVSHLPEVRQFYPRS